MPRTIRTTPPTTTQRRGQITGYATVMLVGGPADEREVRTPISPVELVCDHCGSDMGMSAPQIAVHYYAVDSHGTLHLYVARTLRADDGDVIKADHRGPQETPCSPAEPS
jgi:hypothetical protein